MTNDDAGMARAEEKALVRMAVEALTRPEFYDEIRADPQRAAESLGLELSEDELYFLNDEVEWASIDAHFREMQAALRRGPEDAGPVW